MKIVTSGAPYIDIDGYAGCIGYANFLQAAGFEAKAVSTSVFNSSIASVVRSQAEQLETAYKLADDDEFVIVDMSSPEHLDKIVNPDRIVTVIDHHPGFEKYWGQKLQDQAIIEPVGGACTLVYEAWNKAGLLAKLNPATAKIMACGILDNTLNLKANITGARDKEAYAACVKIATLPADWAKDYFMDCERGLLENLAPAVRDDTKAIRFKTLGETLAVGQLALWGGLDTARYFNSQVRNSLSHLCPRWFVNIINIGAMRSSLLTSENDVAQWLGHLLDAQVANETVLTDRLWLRKEILQRDIEMSAAEP